MESVDRAASVMLSDIAEVDPVSSAAILGVRQVVDASVPQLVPSPGMAHPGVAAPSG